MTFSKDNFAALSTATGLTADDVGAADFGDKYSGTLRVPVQTPGPRGFFSVTEISDIPR